MFDKFFAANRYENSHLNFTNLYMWRKPFDIKFCVEDGVLYLLNRYNGKYGAVMPICADNLFVGAVQKLTGLFEEMAVPFYMGGVEKKYADMITGDGAADFVAVKDENNFDYVYNSDDLINLAGRKYHSKKNHLNAFRKSYPDAEYLPVTEEIITLCKLELNGWYKIRAAEEEDDPFIAYERAAIIEVLNNFGVFKLKGGAIKLGGRIVAFTFGEQLNSDTAVIHVEKADPNVRGAYPAINQGFVEREWAHLAYVNREEDMGLPGLRKAKESYKPVKLIEKFNITLAADKAGQTDA